MEAGDSEGDTIQTEAANNRLEFWDNVCLHVHHTSILSIGGQCLHILEARIGDNKCTKEVCG